MTWTIIILAVCTLLPVIIFGVLRLVGKQQKSLVLRVLRDRHGNAVGYEQREQ